MKLLFDYLPFSMKGAETVVKPKKKAKSSNNLNGNSKPKGASRPKLLKNNNHQNQKSNGTNGNNKASSRLSSTAANTTVIKRTGIESTKIKKKRLKEIKNGNESPRKSPKKASTVKNSSSPKGKRRGNNKKSPELRPRRRASQTYFFKYQLARNPLKAEEEDLKLALLASLQQCGSSTATNSDSQDDQNDQRHPKTKKERSRPQHPNNHHPHHGKRHLHNHQNNNTATNFKQPKHEEQLQQVAKAPPKTYDEEYLKKYRPDTEDFLTFICFRITAPNTTNGTNIETTADETTNDTNSTSTTHHHNSTNHVTNCINNNNTGNKTSDKTTSNDSHQHRRSTSPHKMTANNHVSNSSPNPVSPSNRRRPVRQSPRLANSNRKISESDNTAYDTISYEEDMMKASIALEDMAQEINSKDDIHNEIAQHSSDCVTRSASPFKNNKHLVKGLMTREFAGGFADEEIIFESISNHKL